MSINRTGQIRRPTGTREERKPVGTAGQRQVQIPAREKANSGISPYCVPNEYICAELGHYLRLSTVTGAITQEIGVVPKYWYTTLDFGEEQPLPVAAPRECMERLPELCAATVLFDIFIANGDRTADNLFLNKTFDPPELRLFDHEAALLGATEGQAEGRLTGGLRKQLGISDHCLKTFVTVEQLLESRWSQRIAELPDYLIEETCQEAQQHGMTSVETQAVIDFLKERRFNIYSLVETHRNEFAQ